MTKINESLVITCVGCASAAMPSLFSQEMRRQMASLQKNLPAVSAGCHVRWVSFPRKFFEIASYNSAFPTKGRGQTISRYNTRQSASVSSGLPTYPTSVDTPALCRLCTSLPSHMTPQTIHCTHFSDSSFLSPCCSDIRASTSPNKSSLHSYTP